MLRNWRTRPDSDPQELAVELPQRGATGPVCLVSTGGGGGPPPAAALLSALKRSTTEADVMLDGGRPGMLEMYWSHMNQLPAAMGEVL